MCFSTFAYLFNFQFPPTHRLAEHFLNGNHSFNFICRIVLYSFSKDAESKLLKIFRKVT